MQGHRGLGWGAGARAPCAAIVAPRGQRLRAGARGGGPCRRDGRPRGRLCRDRRPRGQREAGSASSASASRPLPRPVATISSTSSWSRAVSGISARGGGPCRRDGRPRGRLCRDRRPRGQREARPLHPPVPCPARSRRSRRRRPGRGRSRASRRAARPGPADLDPARDRRRERRLRPPRPQRDADLHRLLVPGPDSGISARCPAWAGGSSSLAQISIIAIRRCSR
jgi:hypothetical protein